MCYDTLDTSRSRAKLFIVVNYKNILEEVNTKQGEYVSSLLTLLKLPKEEQIDADKKIQEFAELHKDIPTFADQVVSYYMKK